MVSLNCECAERIGVTILSFSLFEEIESYFLEQVEKKIYADETDYSKVWHEHGGLEKRVFRKTVKQYRCTVCGCLWMLEYPDFPAPGSVRKFQAGVFLDVE
jgi:hypothetical protein